MIYRVVFNMIRTQYGTSAILVDADTGEKAEVYALQRAQDCPGDLDFRADPKKFPDQQVTGVKELESLEIWHDGDSYEADQ